jgi:HD-like signal output (HDOD) protein
MPFTHAMRGQPRSVADPAAAAAEAAAEARSAQAFEFVQKLAAELSAGRVELPAFPEVAIRVHRVLALPEVTDERIARVIASDAGLAARVLAMANSAALSRGGRAIVELRQAVTRVGHQHTRSAAIAYAMGQIRMAESLSHIREDLHAIWQSSTVVAALAHVVAMRTRAANADEAMLAGLMHNIGGVYILARADRHSALFSDAAVRDAVMADWNAQIGRSIAENWCMSDDVAEAIAEQAIDQRPNSGRRDLLDVLSVAVRTAGFQPGVSDPALVVAGANTFDRLGIDASMLEQLIAESAAEVEELRSALGD